MTISDVVGDGNQKRFTHDNLGACYGCELKDADVACTGVGYGRQQQDASMSPSHCFHVIWAVL